MRLASEWLAVEPDSEGKRWIGAQWAIVHPTARVGARASVGEGASVGAWASVGDGAIVGARASVGERHVIARTADCLVLGPCGSRMAMLTVYRSEGVIYVATGCFLGTWDAFVARANAHPNKQARTDYWHLARAAYATLRDRKETA